MIDSSKYPKLSKLVSHALRHEPWIYELELNDEGWVQLSDLITAIQLQSEEWQKLTIDDIEQMIQSSSKKRHEIEDTMIRALYGHSTPQRLSKVPANPPEQLFHGTSPDNAKLILEHGLLPMDRQYVHLSIDKNTAHEVGKRKSRQPVLLVIQAQQANSKRVQFYRGNDVVWLAETVPAEFISIDAW